METRLRELANGKWVAEIKGWFLWKGLWQNARFSTAYTEYRHSFMYIHCHKDTKQDAQDILNDYLAQHGE